MRKDEIRVGKIYCNRGKGKTLRTVLGIGDEYVPTHWFSDNPRPDEPGVWFLQTDRSGHRNIFRDSLYLSSFAQWCGAEVGDVFGNGSTAERLGGE